MTAPGGLEQYIPSLKYLILDECRYPKEELSELKNLVAAIFRLEKSKTTEDILEVINNLIEWLSSPEQARIRSNFNTWIKRVLLPLSDIDPDIPQVNDLEEVRTMLADCIPQLIRDSVKQAEKIAEERGEKRGEERGKKRGEKIGEERGGKKGKKEVLLKLLQLKFGSVPEQIQQQILLANVDQLDKWIEQILTANSINEIFS
jgi:hypothetical protein